MNVAFSNVYCGEVVEELKLQKLLGEAMKLDDWDERQSGDGEEGNEERENEPDLTENCYDTYPRYQNDGEEQFGSKGRRGKRETCWKRSHSCKVVGRKSIVFEQIKMFEEYFDECYKLTIEDIVGEMPVHIQDCSTALNEFGLTTQAFFAVKVEVLNRYQFVKEAWLHKTGKERTQDLGTFRSRKIFTSSYAETAKTTPEPSTYGKPRNWKRRRKKEKIRGLVSGGASTTEYAISYF